MLLFSADVAITPPGSGTRRVFGQCYVSRVNDSVTGRVRVFQHVLLSKAGPVLPVFPGTCLLNLRLGISNDIQTPPSPWKSIPALS